MTNPKRYLVVREVSESINKVNQRLPHPDVETCFKLHELVQEYETDWDNQDYEVFKDYDGSCTVYRRSDYYPSLGTVRMSEGCAKKLCEMLNDGEVEL